MNRTPSSRTVIASGLLVLVWLLLVPPLFAQTETPTVSPSPVETVDSTASATPTVTPLTITEQVVLSERPGWATLSTTFEVDASIPNPYLILRVNPPGSLEVTGSRLNGQPANFSPESDGTGYRWAVAPGTSQTLEVDLMVGPAGQSAAPVLELYDAGAMSLGLLALSPPSLEALRNASSLSTTATAAAGETALTATAIAQTATLKAASDAATQAAQATAALSATPPTPPAEPNVPPEAQATPVPPTTGDGLGDMLVPLLLTALFLIAAVIIGLLFLSRRRASRAAIERTQRQALAPLPPAAETVTGVLMAVYLQLEGDTPQAFPIADTPFAIGRGPSNNLIIDETFPHWQTVSREHAIISRHSHGYVIEDRGSQNGVRVNGRLTPKNLLRNGWQVSVGGVDFRFVDETQLD